MLYFGHFLQKESHCIPYTKQQTEDFLLIIAPPGRGKSKRTELTRETLYKKELISTLAWVVATRNSWQSTFLQTQINTACRVCVTSSLPVSVRTTCYCGLSLITFHSMVPTSSSVFPTIPWFEVLCHGLKKKLRTNVHKSMIWAVENRNLEFLRRFHFILHSTQIPTTYFPPSPVAFLPY